MRHVRGTLLRFLARLLPAQRGTAALGRTGAPAPRCPAVKACDSMRRRIVRAYLLFSLAGCACFTLAAMIVVERLEQRLVDERLYAIAAWAAPRQAGHLGLAMPSGINFYHGDAIPGSLGMLADGVHKVRVDGIGLHVLAGHHAQQPYVVLEHESAYDQIGSSVYAMLALGLSGFLAFAAVLGRFMARRIVDPIVELANSVSGRGPLPLCGSNDELGFLARAFAARTEELQQFLARERLFTGDVSHELRTPLCVIAGAAEVLMAQAGEQASLYAPAERIYRSARDAADSVSILLLLARTPDLIGADRLSLAAIAAEEVARLQILVLNKPLTLSYAGGQDFFVHAPARLVAAVIGNLIRNACMYTERGSVTVALDGASVLVTDTGTGMPIHVQAMLNGATTACPLRGSEGAGLGLALVKRICAYLGADLALTSQTGQGTVFKIGFRQI
jgi:signal transduction histidine kinase